jgi:hypothetical protein
MTEFSRGENRFTLYSYSESVNKIKTESLSYLGPIPMTEPIIAFLWMIFAQVWLAKSFIAINLLVKAYAANNVKKNRRKVCVCVLWAHLPARENDGS